MANTHPYCSPGSLVKAVQQFRKSFPKEVTAETLRKLAIAPKNESYVLNVFRFLGFIDADGNKVTEKSKAFTHHDDAKFNSEFGATVKIAYSELFDLHGDDAWESDNDTLVQFFRTSDDSSDVVGKRQAQTFSALAALAGHGELPVPKAANSSNNAPASKKTVAKKNTVKVATEKEEKKEVEKKELNSADVGLTVRIEVNLPADGDQQTYDNIFSSIRKNLIDGV